MSWRVLRVLTIAVLAGASAVLVRGQAGSDTRATFRLYLSGREAGREVSVLSNVATGHTIASTVTWRDRGADMRLTADVDADFDWEPRHLVLKGQPFYGGAADLDVTVDGTRATFRDRGTTSTIDVGDGLFFSIDGALPVALQESLVAYWRGHGRPASIASAPGGALRIQLRAEEHVDAGGRTIVLERLAIDGPVWGRQTAWAEPGGNLVALVTWLDGVPFQAVRDGFEARLDRFVERAQRDRIEDLGKLTIAPEHGQGVVLTGATVVPSAGRLPIPDAVVVVRNGRIAAVGPSSSVKAPGDLPAVNAAGMTIIPGLWDADARISQIEDGPLNLAFGITTIRNAGPDHALAAALRAAIADREGAFLGPRMIPAGSIDLEGPSGAAASIDDVRARAREFRNAGLRRLDVSGRLTPDLFRVALAEGRRLSMGISGGVPEGITVAEAIEAGLDLLIGTPAPANNPPAAWAALLVRRQAGFAPELAAADPARADDRLPRSVARRVAAYDRRPLAGGRADRLAAVKAARDVRVSVVAGSGSTAPVARLLRELELLVEAGFSPADALQAATAAPARVLKTEDAGVIEPGKRADLVVLTKNPLDDISNIRTAKWVVVNGRLYDCEKLRTLVD